jgi:polysaccharide biosynthesis/export protein
MKKNTLTISALLFIFSLSISNKISAQVAGMQSISPSMLSQFGNMSSQAKRDLAGQYGVNLDDLGLGDNNGMNDELSTANDKISSEASEILYKRIIDAEENTKKAKEYRSKNTPIFERDYDALKDLPVYGEFLFDGNHSTFAPIDNAPVPSNYVMGTGDSLRILLYGTTDSEINLTVNRNGSINFPELGEISIAGMTFTEANKYIKTRVSKQMIGVEVSISVGRLRAINIFVAGEATVPGAYSVSALSTVSQLLFVAGGINDIGSLRNIQIRRSNVLIATFDLYDLLTKGNAEGDIRLQSGDVIFVPPSKKNIFIDGAVKRPGKYELKENETISDLFDLVGGPENRAYLKQISIERYDQNTDIPSIINLDLTDKINLDYKIIDGDVIRIAQVSDSLSNSVILKGSVKRPGKYGWYERMRFTNLLSSINVDFSSNFDLSKGLIIRRKNINNYDIEVIDLNIKTALENPKSDLDPYLELHDEVLIFSLGFNNDTLNDIEIYNPKDDIDHPLYGKEIGNFVEGGQQDVGMMNPQMMNPQMMNPQMMNQSMMADDQMRDRMTDEELLIVIHESEMKEKYNYLNQGKRRILLKSVIDKLNQQATSSEPPEIVSISGAVKIPGQYPLTKNATYIDLIELAGGYKDDAYVQAAEIRRTLVNESGAMIVDTSDIDLTKLSKTNLESRDHLHIRSIKDWEARDTVVLGGEVFYPGSYLISPNETLLSVIKRAGGFTDESFVGGAIFTRESIKLKEREQLQILGDTIRRDQAARSMTKESEDFSVSSSEVEASISALLSSAVYGRLIIDIPRLMGGDNTADIVLQDGDELIIPKFTNAVTVVGEVRRSGSFVLQDNFKINDYIQLAAGMTSRGDQKEIYIIRANGTVKKGIEKKSLFAFTPSVDEVQAGDTIVIPIKSSYQTPLNLYSTVSQVIFQSIASIAAFSTILN